ncbi:MAG: nicotinate-nucleotide adenylyltransferase [Gammaproteobacteria bacterium]
MLGILGGTFDPIHYGHLRCALELKQDLPLRELRLVPCGMPPHRESPHASVEQRLRMLQAAVADSPEFIIDTRELSRSGPSYSVDTLRALRTEQGATPLCLIVGQDAFNALDSWHCWQELMDLAHIVVAHRPGWTRPQHGAVADLLSHHGVTEVAALQRQAAGCILPWPVTALDISATAIRASIAAGKSPRYLLPDAVWRIIAQERLYAAGTPLLMGNPRLFQP